MVMSKYLYLFWMILLVSSVSAFQFNGTVLDVEGNPLNGSLINITVRGSNFGIIGYNGTLTNGSGWFNLSVSDIAGALYDMQITQVNESSGTVTWIGQNMPAFPSQVLQAIAGTTFYLKEAGTINITAINASSISVPFRYQIKDQALGYPVAMQFDSLVQSALVNIPKDRQYSIMIYPNNSMPISFNWNNFSANSSYTVNQISTYNVTTDTLHYKFNTTMNLVQVSGYINYTGISGWDEFVVVPYLIEPGNMIHLNFGDLPFNLSSFLLVNNGSDPNNLSGRVTDIFNTSSGFYNITLPSTPAETSAIMLFATARNGTVYYGGFKNISTIGSGIQSFNFTAMSVLLGDHRNITRDTLNGEGLNSSTAMRAFTIVNSTNNSMTSISAHIEVTVDYSAFGAQEFTWMLDIDQGTNSIFYVPLPNLTGVKEMNVFVSGGNGDFAPKQKSYTFSQVQTPQNITVTGFQPGDIDGASLSGLNIALIKSNTTCDIPIPSAGCYIGSSESGQAFGEEGGFNPMSAVLGGGKLSFRMGLLSSGIIVHYVNVDMLASGPPDALFDDSATSDTSSGFSSAMRFGSAGPTIYDYVLISMPYSEAASGGLDDSNPVNISIPVLYDDNWNVIWNASSNGTDAAHLAANHSHYSAQQAAWAKLLNQTTCGTNQSSINVTNPCYIDASNNRIWIRLPHFSGTGPSVTGAVTAAAAANNGGGSSTSIGTVVKPSTAASAGATGGESTPLASSAYQSWSALTPSQSAQLAVSNDELGVTHVAFSVTETVQDAWMKVEKVDALPSSVSAFTRPVYKHVEMSWNIPETKANDVTITFKVAKEWLTSNSLAPDHVALHRYSNDWTELPTSVEREDVSFVYYAATTPGFSYFVIAGKEIEPTGVETAETVLPESSVPVPGQKTNMLPVIIVLLLLFGALIYWKMKK